ncbi:hypothetical protein [Methanothrix sp.]|uniref:hypothetical protein n=1 Tax=Methanothrix sp. TaxID=90426 RepID=UPI003C76A4AF
MILITALLACPAWAGCGRWVIRDNSDYLSDPDFDQAVASSTGSAATLNPDGTARVSGGEAADDNDHQKEAQNREKALLGGTPGRDLGGEWKVQIDMKTDRLDEPGGKDRQQALDLILIQREGQLQGYGSLIEGGIELPAAASGRISADSVSLIVSLVGQKREYRLDLTANNDGMRGICELYESERLAGRGNATASRLSS